MSIYELTGDISPINYFYFSGNTVDKSNMICYLLFMNLDYETAAALLSQLGNKTRLKVVRELVRAGNRGMAVGEIKQLLLVPDSTLSHHLSHLRNAGLISQKREGTTLRCQVDFEKIDSIVKFLTEECCAAEITA